LKGAGGNWIRSFPNCQFRRGDCLLALTNFAGQASHFSGRCDVDALPFRGDSRINGVIEIPGKICGRPAEFFDAAAALGKIWPAGVCGQETFFEHVHFTLTEISASLAWAEKVEKNAARQQCLQDAPHQRLGVAGNVRCTARPDGLEPARS